MIRFAKIAALSVLVLLTCATPAWAQGGTTMDFKTLGVGLTTLGAAYGIGKLAAAALEGMARQPEVAGNIQTAMIIAAALIEGFTFFALFVCMRA